MRSFEYSSFKSRTWDVEIVNYLSAIHEAKGRQQLYLKQKEAVLEKLVEIAKIQSTESSNAIEGIRTTETRLKQLMSEKTTPQNRDEREILGYRDALNVVHESFEYIPLTPNYILQLHEIMFSHTDSGHGGQFKNVQNYIRATMTDTMQQLCDAFNMAIGEGIVDPLILIPAFIHDFLCIHPFIDGNGRMSRLLTTLLLYRSGYYVGRYISLEAQIAQTKDYYYDALEQSQDGWHEQSDDPTPVVKYILGTIIAAYRDFEDRVNLVEEKKAAIDVVRGAVVLKIGKFKKTDICELCPSLSAASVERSLKALCKSGEIEMMGSGRTTFYVRKSL